MVRQEGADMGSIILEVFHDINGTLRFLTVFG